MRPCLLSAAAALKDPEKAHLRGAGKTGALGPLDGSFPETDPPGETSSSSGRLPSSYCDIW
jgi:hypothetical protein